MQNMIMVLKYVLNIYAYYTGVYFLYAKYNFFFLSFPCFLFLGFTCSWDSLSNSSNSHCTVKSHLSSFSEYSTSAPVKLWLHLLEYNNSTLIQPTLLCNISHILHCSRLKSLTLTSHCLSNKLLYSHTHSIQSINV